MKTPLSKTSVLTPKTFSELKELIADLHIQETPWLPTGLETRLKWGAPIKVPSHQVSVRSFNHIIDHAIDDLTITVEAGMQLSDLQKVLIKKKQWIPIDWPWGSNPNSYPSSSGSIGGLMARGLSGSLRQKYMGVRDQIIGIGVIRTDGIEAHAGGKVVKNVAGYDLMRLLCGSWGSLALITELTIRTQPIRDWRKCIEIEGQLEELECFRSKLIHSKLTPEYCDWISTNKNDWRIQIGLASISKNAINDQVQGIEVMAANYKTGTKIKSWEGPLPETQIPNITLAEEYWLLRISLPPKQVYHLLKSDELQSISSLNWRLAAGIGVGDGWQPANKKGSLGNAVINLRSKVESLGGKLVIINQPNHINPKLLAWLDVSSKPLIESVKIQFDPKKQLSIGRLPGVSG